MEHKFTEHKFTEHHLTENPSTEQVWAPSLSYEPVEAVSASLQLPSSQAAPSEKVSPEKVQKLYREFRKAALTSAAREMQQQERIRLKDQVSILNVPIDSLSINEFLNNLKRGVVFTPNVDHLMKLQRDQEFVEVYKHADFRVCDSQILMFASKFLGTPIKAKISGSDLLPSFCQYHKANEKVKIFLLGGAEGIAARARQRINARTGREIVVASHSPSYGFEHNEEECQAILEMIRQSSANVLVIGVGCPKQEKWIVKYKDQMPNIDIFLAVGAAIGFEAGNKARAPEFVSQLGLEWLYRLLSEPKRLWKRYLVDDLPFLWLLLKEKWSQIHKMKVSPAQLPPQFYSEASE
jgi:exopolysaccharide biosynthesis WecB/TagA/CpsF family protein